MKNLKRIRYLFSGQVQGVGFRPHVYRVSHDLRLTGLVFNHSTGVTAEVQGENAEIFSEKLIETLPILASVDNVESVEIEIVKDESEFVILKSQYSSKVLTKISPDVSICKDCLSELFDNSTRFYHYPFLNCTNCGPRLTIVHDLPYDRAKTTMSDFPMCTDCLKEYNDPLNRRYHAQPTACPKCGPQLSDSIESIVKDIRNGKIVAVKAVGGYQLICDARNDGAVKRLRERKNREAKPFALMMLNIDSIKQLADCSIEEEKILIGFERPIVLLKKNKNKEKNELPESINDGLKELGIMLPNSPIHYLIFHGLMGFSENKKWLDELCNDVLVVTSANPGVAPLIIDDEIALKELSHIADKIVSYNRDILTRVDDSVLRVINKKTLFIRRARGYVPNSIKLSKECVSGLSVGAFLKNTFCISRGSELFVSQHIGSLSNKQTIDFFHETLEHMLNMLDVKPEFIAHDAHPDFYTTHFALDFADKFNIKPIPVQHHHAHIASVCAEHNIDEPVLGLSLDGYGYGLNGELWGGELLLVEKNKFERISSLYPIKQPGGDSASKEPWKMAVSVLHELGLKEDIFKRFGKEKYLPFLIQMLEKGIQSPLTTSCGRLFDAASAILGITLKSDYEGQAAMKMESLVTNPVVDNSGWIISEKYISFLPLINKLIYCDPISGSNLFHGTLASGISEWVRDYSKKTGIKKIAMSGGCFLNRVLVSLLTNQLQSYGLMPLINYKVPPNDGGLSLGQIWCGFK